MRKIVLVSNTSWALYNFRLGLINFFIESNIEVFCIANYDDYSDKLIKKGVSFVESDLDNKGLNPFYDLQYQNFLLNQYKRIQPDFIFHYTVKPNIYGSIAANKLGIRSVAFVSGTGYPFLKKNFINFIVKKLYRLAGTKCSEMWFINKEDLALFINEKLVSKTKAKLLPGEGVDVQHFYRDTLYPGKGHEFTFLLSSRMLWDKGVGVYVEAARIVKKKFPQAKFQLLGFVDKHSSASISQKQIDKWVNEGVVQYLGGTDDVRDQLNKINCFVLPTYYKEGIPKSLLEASSLEIPIITTDNVGCREVVKEGYNGLLCEPRSAGSLANCMEKMIEMDYEALKKMGQNGRRKVDAEFNEEIVLNLYKKSLRPILENKSEFFEVALG